ncbi:hypothetical protein M011DRAFT_273567 [Sporormia fimetaria CBS 119925]|uniref:Uncharacterized protein n=1 Tax=Sporormia fimetaria CBS 119925 TaxID=1340428 RepID=A0A6A6VGE1_9PLEO|nr:hypothetical protein M011DRAFT_273567 [Sporormia fimetaria CBS 119925]
MPEVVTTRFQGRAQRNQVVKNSVRSSRLDVEILTHFSYMQSLSPTHIHPPETVRTPQNQRIPKVVTANPKSVHLECRSHSRRKVQHKPGKPHIQKTPQQHKRSQEQTRQNNAPEKHIHYKQQNGSGKKYPKIPPTSTITPPQKSPNSLPHPQNMPPRKISSIKVLFPIALVTSSNQKGTQEGKGRKRKNREGKLT